MINNIESKRAKKRERGKKRNSNNRPKYYSISRLQSSQYNLKVFIFTKKKTENKLEKVYEIYIFLYHIGICIYIKFIDFQFSIFLGTNINIFIFRG